MPGEGGLSEKDAIISKILEQDLSEEEIKLLAEKVFEIIKRELVLESERLGKLI